MAELGLDDRKQLLSLPNKLPEMVDERRRRLLLADAGLEHLADRIDLAGATSTAAGEIVVEIEGIGFLEAARDRPSVQALVIRGISDKIQSKPPKDA